MSSDPTPTKTKMFSTGVLVPPEQYTLDYFERYPQDDSGAFLRVLAVIDGKMRKRQKEGYLTQRFNQKPSSRQSNNNYPGYIALYIRKETKK